MNDDTATTRILNDLRGRLERAEATCTKLATTAYERGQGGTEARLAGKAQGLALAKSYLDEYLRGAHAIYTDGAA